MRGGLIIGVIIALVLLVSGYVMGHSVTRHDGVREWVARPIAVRNEKGDNKQFAQAPSRSNRCVTPTFSCFLAQAVPVGTPCWCATPYGPVGGVVR